jgi:type IV pilus assembly protein PilY1
MRFPIISRCDMHVYKRISIAALLATAATGTGMLIAPPVRAVDTEVFFSNVVSEGKPNVLFILDTSQSMYSVEDSAPDVPYDSAQLYAGACLADVNAANKHYYWAEQGQATPICGAAGAQALEVGQFDCLNWMGQVNTNGFQTNGPVRVAQFVAGKWQTISQMSALTTCEGDSTQPGPINWNGKGKSAIASKAYTFYDGNYLNYLASSGGGNKYRIDVVREVVAKLAKNTTGVRMGLMRYGFDGARVFLQNAPNACEVLPDSDESTLSGNGAPIIYPITDLDGAPVPGMPGATVREQLAYQLGVDANGNIVGWIVDPSVPDANQPQKIAYGNGINCPIPLMTPGGRSPIGGGMQEAYRYFAGKKWSLPFGAQAAVGSTYAYPSVVQSRTGEIYNSPITGACSKNYIILLSDGTTEQDNNIDGYIEGLPGFEQKVGSRHCDVEPYLVSVPPPSECVDDIAEYMFESDLSAAQPGIQNVITYTVGFKIGPNTDPEALSARSLLEETASRGGGKFYEAQNAQDLEGILTEVLRRVLTDNAAFSAPAISVNAFNRTQNLNDLYVSLFRPGFDYRWLGNVKKYQLALDGDILDGDGNQAVDPATGFFLSTAHSFWSDVIDGNDITEGGAAGELDDYANRDLYSNLSGVSNVALSAAGNALSQLKTAAYAVTAPLMLGIQAGDTLKQGDAASGALTANDLVDWAYGKDIGDVDGDTITDESRRDMGDPLHGRPVTIIYGGTAASPDINDAAVLVITNDGYLQSIDPVTGAENWSFVPEPLLSRMRNLYYNPDTQPEDRVYGLDGNIRVWRKDVDGNGIIEPADGDFVRVIFGQRRGGGTYFAVDVTNKQQPTLMWMHSYAAEGAGQSWSVPQIAKVRIGVNLYDVIVFGGGYDTTQDDIPYSTDTVGRGIYIANATNGNLLWRAGPSGSGANLELADMTNAFPGDVRVLDLTADGVADRIYAADLGGRVWRFDIFNGQPASGAEGSRLVEGGVLASLGNAEDAVKSDATTIRFFYAPDPALVTLDGITYINVAIGSGHRELPISDIVGENWFFSVRDYNVYRQLLTSQYQATCPDPPVGPCQQTVTEDDLVDLTNTVGAAATVAVPIGSPGWKLDLQNDGEKVLAESRTFQGNVFFTTYSPLDQANGGESCSITFGLNKLYVVSATDARPPNNFDGDATTETVDDRSKDLAQGSIAPEVVFVYPGAQDPENCVGEECAPPPVCLIGLESCGTGFSNPPVRTYWREEGTQ